MAENSKIEWTHATFNPWRGCTKVSPGCANCYAETLSGRNQKTLGVWGPQGKRVVAAESYWKLPLKWDRAAREAGERHRVFCASLADVFEDWQGPMVDSQGETFCRCPSVGCRDCNRWISTYRLTGDSTAWTPYCFDCQRGCLNLTMQDVRRRLFDLIDRTPYLDWLLLTKRPENIAKMIPEHSPRRQCPAGVRDTFRSNVWFGASVEDQQRKHRIDILRDIPATIRFLSLEPLLQDLGTLDLRGIHWVIVGGESGHGARPMHPDWVRSIRDQCQAAGVPFFFKQWGEYSYSFPDDAYEASLQTKKPHRLVGDDPPSFGLRVGKKSAGRLLDGRLWDEFPKQAKGW